MDDRGDASLLSQRGQILAMFALMIVVLTAMMGLAIDVAHARSTAERAQRAAEAGVLAGVALLPDPVTGNGYNASVQAISLASQNDFPCAVTGTSPTTTTITLVPGDYEYVYIYTCNSTTTIVVSAFPKNDRLEETISTTVSTPFLQVVKRGSFTVSRSAAAVYKDPVQMGAPDNELGFAAYKTHAFDYCPPGSLPTCGTNRAPGTALPQDFYLQSRGHTKDPSMATPSARISRARAATASSPRPAASRSTTLALPAHARSAATW